MSRIGILQLEEMGLAISGAADWTAIKNLVHRLGRSQRPVGKETFDAASDEVLLASQRA
ncbi:hypothetical protein OAS39_01265 [Pirellulales bacterium]|nr:hypothetical protein [Pirellulales bacterium]